MFNTESEKEWGWSRAFQRIMHLVKSFSEDKEIVMSTFTSRFGFHPCSKETYLKLKKLNWFRLMDLHMEAKWDRWNRKLPKNRLTWTANVNGGKTIWTSEPWEEPERCPVAISHFIEADYKEARYPKATEAEVVPLKLTESAIDQQLQLCEEWYASRATLQTVS